ncbi:hypothetical protein [Actinoplanes aureus]|uniref:Uncharacterized protein n=1 Tax=Actinoplanes aureus TaxID=2792083 RepID=A0A931CEU1_9ACTN|nr:hypothetical protein [Actinoplanes aureus]MBG0565883.1 hypothetical protein [Actinoplanes aureus]
MRPHRLPDRRSQPLLALPALLAMMDDRDRLALAQRLLRDLPDDPPARLAAVLALLFGQRLTHRAAQMPPALLAEQIGLSVGAAAK